MSMQELTKMIAEIRRLREETLAALSEMDETEIEITTQMERWTEIRRVLLRFGDHMREHTTQINGARSAIKRDPTMSQRILAESEIAWGLLLASMVGLSDDDLDQKPPDGSWSIRETLSHIAETERRYLQVIQDARLREP
jgi:uncharacterized damage-inducible protein DinB